MEKMIRDRQIYDSQVTARIRQAVEVRIARDGDCQPTNVRLTIIGASTVRNTLAMAYGTATPSWCLTLCDLAAPGDGRVDL